MLFIIIKITRSICTLWIILYDINKFINVYHPHKTSYFNKYRKSSRKNFFLAKQANEILNYGDSNGYYSCGYVDEDAYNKNEQPMLEYELYIYFREYYNTVYELLYEVTKW